MPYGMVLLPDRATHDLLVELAGVIGGPDPINKLGDHAPAHVSVIHFDGPPEEIEARAAAHPVRTLQVRPIGLLYTVVSPGDYYVPQGGVYHGIEIVRRPDLNALHAEALSWVRESGATPLGAVGADYRPHITLGMTATPVLPDLRALLLGEIYVRPAFGKLGPYGTFPGLLCT
ncbi:MAG TPA: hypothetical protein VF657_25170 [Actinoplanes sp.]